MKLSSRLKKTMNVIQALYDEDIDERRERVASKLREKYPKKNLYELKKIYDEEIVYQHISAIEVAIEAAINRKWLWEDDVRELEKACRIEGYDYSGLHDAGFKF